MSPSLLVSLLTGKKEDLDLARRRIGYDRLVLLATPEQEGQARTVEEVEQGLGGCTVVVVDEPDVDRILERLRTIMAEHQEADIRLNAAGGTHAMSTAMMVYAFETGHPTWFSQEGRHVRLPVLEGVGLVERVDTQGRMLLAALGRDGARAADLIRTMGSDEDQIAALARRLADTDLVALTARDGRLYIRPTDTAHALGLTEASAHH